MGQGQTGRRRGNIGGRHRLAAGSMRLVSDASGQWSLMPAPRPTQYVGRVGALAILLGVGAAIFCALPALALNRDSDGGIAATALATPAYPIGMFADTVFTADAYRVPNGGQLLLYSDGAYELPLDDERRSRFSLDNFVSLCTELAVRPGWSLDDLVNRLRLCSPTGDFDDDCALVLLTFP